MPGDESFDVIIIGAGPGGTSAAYALAKDGYDVLVIERGKYVGSKNVFGGRIYSYPFRELYGEAWREAPVERYITHENLVFMSETSAFTIQFEDSRAGEEAKSFTAVRRKFDRWMADMAEAEGATVITGIRVDDLWMDGGRVVGVVAGPDRVRANVVIGADGAISTFARRAGLRGDILPEEMAVGVKEIIDLPKNVIEERFNLGPDEGAVYIFSGYASGYLRGGGFLYTNKTNLSLGLVIRSEDLSARRVGVHEVMENFRLHPAVQKFVKGGKVVEYSAHLVPEVGRTAMRGFCSDGFLAVGDAAGFLLNNGYTFRGVDLAVSSGVAAAEAAKEACEAGRFDRAALSAYDRQLREGGLLGEMETFSRALRFMENPRLYDLYPQLICDIAQKVYSVEGMGKERVLDVVLEESKGRLPLFRTLLDMLGGARAM
jgi:electron transfer flavoprotein-quinone oxidoreductase